MLWEYNCGSCSEHGWRRRKLVIGNELGSYCRSQLRARRTRPRLWWWARERGKGCKRHSGNKISIAWQPDGYKGSERIGRWPYCGGWRIKMPLIVTELLENVWESPLSKHEFRLNRAPCWWNHSSRLCLEEQEASWLTAHMAENFWWWAETHRQ